MPVGADVGRLRKVLSGASESSDRSNGLRYRKRRWESAADFAVRMRHDAGMVAGHQQFPVRH